MSSKEKLFDLNKLEVLEYWDDIWTQPENTLRFYRMIMRLCEHSTHELLQGKHYMVIISSSIRAGLQYNKR